MQEQEVIVIEQETFQNQLFRIHKFIQNQVQITSPKLFYSKLKSLRIEIQSSLKYSQYIDCLTRIIVTILIDNPLYLCVLGIILNQFCENQKKSYWQILQFLLQIKKPLAQSYQKSPEKFTRIPISFLVELQNQQNNYQFQCYCQKFEKKPLQSSLKQIESQRCPSCLEFFHKKCQSQIILCSKCFLMNNSISYRRIKTLFFSGMKLSNIITIIKFEYHSVSKIAIAENQFIDVRIRIFLRNKQTMHYFLHNYCLYVNSQLLAIKKANKSHLLLEIKIPNRILEIENSVILKQEFILDKKYSNMPLYQKENLIDPYLIGIYQVVPLSKKRQLLSNTLLRMKKEDMWRFYQSINKFSKNNHDTIKRISIYSPMRQEILSVPIRSLLCKHFQCFDYLDLLKENSKKHFQCPICSKAITSIYIDSIFEEYLKIIQANKNTEPLILRFSKDQQTLLAIDNIHSKNDNIIQQ